jgi:hypothetical protein
MSDFHLSADLPANPEERTAVMAKGFEMALTHAATDPELRLRMILGEACCKLNDVVSWLRLELEKEKAEVREMARKFDRQPELLARKVAEPIASVQQRLLHSALKKDGG